MIHEVCEGGVLLNLITFKPLPVCPTAAAAGDGIREALESPVAG